MIVHPHRRKHEKTALEHHSSLLAKDEKRELVCEKRILKEAETTASKRIQSRVVEFPEGFPASRGRIQIKI